MEPWRRGPWLSGKYSFIYVCRPTQAILWVHTNCPWGLTLAEPGKQLCIWCTRSSNISKGLSFSFYSPPVNILYSFGILFNGWLSPVCTQGHYWTTLKENLTIQMHTAPTHSNGDTFRIADFRMQEANCTAQLSWKFPQMRLHTFHHPRKRMLCNQLSTQRPKHHFGIIICICRALWW